MRTIFLFTLISGFIFTTGCHAHKPDKVVVVKKGHHNKVVLIDNDHKRKDYRIVHVRPGKNAVCKKHKKHWHCI
ncbi:MAG: hypothetical protein R3E90_02385 [Marinicella sp.]